MRNKDVFHLRQRSAHTTVSPALVTEDFRGQRARDTTKTFSILTSDMIYWFLAMYSKLMLALTKDTLTSHLYGQFQTSVPSGDFIVISGGVKCVGGLGWYMV